MVRMTLLPGLMQLKTLLNNQLFEGLGMKVHNSSFLGINMKVVNIMVGGPVNEVPIHIIKKHQDEIWLGIDYGATFLLQQGIIPAVAAGDFDSTNVNELNHLRSLVDDVRILPAEKDVTDTQYGTKLALNEYHPDQINIFGGTGGRIDQLLANLFMPLQDEFLDHLEKIRFIDRENTIDYYRPGKYEIVKNPRMRYLAFVNLTPVRGLTLPDEKYQLTDYDSDIPFCWSSNEFDGEINHFEFTKGVVAVIQSFDELHGNN